MNTSFGEGMQPGGTPDVPAAPIVPANFEGTTVPKIHMGDEPWLGALVLDPRQEIDAAYLDDLNRMTELSLNGMATAREVLRRRQASQSDDFTTACRPNMANTAYQKRTEFYKLLRGGQVLVNPVKYFVRNRIGPLQIVTVSRVLHDYAGHRVGQVIGRGTALYTYRADHLDTRLRLLADGGINPLHVLLRAPTILKLSDPQELTRRASAAEDRFLKKQDKRADTPSAPPPPHTEAPPPDPVAEYRYGRLIDETGFGRETIVAAFGAVAGMTPRAFERFVGGAIAAAGEHGVDLKPRHLLPLLPPPSDKAK